MELNERQSDLLLAAFSVAPRDGVTFSWGEVGATCGYDRDESEDLSRILEKSDYLRMDGDTATLTPEGREEARRIKRQTVTFTPTKEQGDFLLAAAVVAGVGREYDMESLARNVGLPDWHETRTKFMEMTLLHAGSVFGHDVLTRNGMKAAEQLDRHRRKEATETAEGSKQ